MKSVWFFFLLSVLLRFGFAQNLAIDELEKFDFRSKTLSDAQLKALSDDELKLLRGFVFGRHGRVFKESFIQNYLSELSWYKAHPKFSNSMLNDVERDNVDRIRGEESKRHKHIQPGDLRFWKDRAIAEKDLKDTTRQDLHIMAAEIEAIHGKRFDNEPALQSYFEDRYWYKASLKYDPKRLSATERKNLQTLRGKYAAMRGLKLQPGDMLAYQSKPIEVGQLKHLSLFELRILRNEVYALRGRRFRTQWLQMYFDGQEWYRPLPDHREPALGKVEQRNIATIVAYENGIHQSLSTTKITEEAVAGLFVEDFRKLQNEIYARHGKVFKDKWLQGYFASLAWYKPNPNYSDKMLTPIERQNVKTIGELMADAVSELEAAEG